MVWITSGKLKTIHTQTGGMSEKGSASQFSTPWQLGDIISQVSQLSFSLCHYSKLTAAAYYYDYHHHHRLLRHHHIIIIKLKEYQRNLLTWAILMFVLTLAPRSIRQFRLH
jgi:hypothetical protein